MPDPTSIAPILLVLVSGILIVCGARTTAGKGPGALIQPGSRSRRAIHRADRLRRNVGRAFIVMGLLVFLLIFVDFSAFD